MPGITSTTERVPLPFTPLELSWVERNARTDIPYPVGTVVALAPGARMGPERADHRNTLIVFDGLPTDHGRTLIGTVERERYRTSGQYSNPWVYPGVYVRFEGYGLFYAQSHWIDPAYLSIPVYGVDLRHSERTPWCVECGDERSLLESGEAALCGECGYQCPGVGAGGACGAWVSADDTYQLLRAGSAERQVCAGCINSSRVITCEHCDAHVTRAYASHCQSCGYVCSTCAGTLDYCEHCEESTCDSERHTDCRPWNDYDDENYSSGSSVIYNYSYRPSLEFRSLSTETNARAFLGAEIEINAAANLADVITEAARGLIYCKEDSSIDRGFEMVTHPMTYAWFMSSFPFDALRDLTSRGADASPHGLHVHISRAAFEGQDHIRRWLDLCYAPGNREALTAFVRRDPTHWGSLADGYHNADKASGGRYAPRYSFVNAGNSETFEVRGFASSLDPEEVQAALGFVHASCEYARQVTEAVPTGAATTNRYGEVNGMPEWDAEYTRALSWQSFADWVGGRAEYAPLLAQMRALTGVQPVSQLQFDFTALEAASEASEGATEAVAA